MKKTLSVIFLFFFLLLSGCNNKPTESISELFLLKFYTTFDTTSMQQSYDKFISSSVNEEDTLEFHKPLTEFVTDKGLASIVLNRAYLRLHEIVLNNQLTLEPFNIVLNENENSIDFSLTVKVASSSSGIEKEIKQSGQIIISDTGKIDGVYFNNIGDLHIEQ